MPADRRQSRIAQARANVANDGNIINNYHIGGGRGGAGGEGRNGAGGDGGQGTGASLGVDAQARYLSMSTHLHFDSRAGDSHANPVAAPYIQQNIHHHGDRGRLHGIDILHHATVLEAIHDSTDSFMEPKCHPETRTQMLQDLHKWALDPYPKTTILWLYGPAGAGKSAIMRTLATQLHKNGRLGGCFFFKRGHATRGNAKTLFTTVAYQLALNIERLRAPISQVVEQNPSIVARSMATQMQELISKPCRAHEHPDPIVIFIDGLDECDGSSVQGEILHTIQSLFLNHPLFLRFMVASRPEPQIRQALNSSSSHYCSFNVEQSFHDVRKYLGDEFSRIHRNHPTMAKIPSPWPEPSVLEMLVRKSSGYFIYASTIIKFIGDENYRPTVRLEVVQNTNGPGSESAYDALDQLYMTILSSAPRQSELTPILGAIVHFRVSPEGIDRLFRLAQGESRLILWGLHSVLSIPPRDDEIRSHHASFLDFLNHPDRSGNFYVNTLICQIGLARSLLQYYAAPFQRHRIPALSNLIRFIVSLPPSGGAGVAELFPLIGSINPDHIFDPKRYEHLEESKSGYDDFKSIVSWLKSTPSAPRDIIQLWEDYAFMFSIETRQWDLFIENIISPNPGILCILVSMGLLRYKLWELPTVLDRTWTDLRITLCSLRPKSVGDAHMLSVHQPQTSSHWNTRDLALQLIRKMVKNHMDTDGGVNPAASRDALRYNVLWPLYNLEQAYIISQYYLGFDISYLVRLSPPCPALYRELWSIPPSEIWSSQPSSHKLIQHVSKWLESFPDPAMDLITF
ncbi:putative nwd2 protein [Mycena sanguinolenta]|uniref:Putative nwd2 protein n=1 Tax=Mycena sanguinolenta TaxID=230812 RepID=A0A8H6WYX6_9AGAR|nr:putative nwd2 protein [Mycena sanguinolenta]